MPVTKRYGFFILVHSLIISAFGWRSGEMEVKVYLKNIHDARQLESLGVNGDIRLTSGFARVHVIGTELKALENRGYKYEILKDDLNAYYTTGFYPENRSFQTSDDIYKAMNGLVQSFPALCAKHEFGKSVRGKELSALKISDNVAKNENEAKVLFDAGIHGDEVGGPDLLVRFARYLCEKYSNDQKITDMVNSRELWFFCMVNPDGRPDSRDNANGKDLNRNYGYMTDDGFSQPETRAVRNCLLRTQFSIHISYHQGCEYLLYPWCFKAETTPDKSIHASLCTLYSTASGYYKASKNVQSYADYPTTGETIDYSYGTAGVAALTMELSEAKASLTDTYYNANRPAMMKLIECAGYGIEGIVTDAAAKTPVSAIIFVNDYYPIYSNPDVGDYHNYLPEGTYSVKVIANGYKPKTVSDVAVSAGKATVADIALERAAGSKSVYGYKVVFAEKGTGKTFDLLGGPDSKTFAGKFVLDMQHPIADIAGSEIKVYPAGGSYTCSAGETADGPWKPLGSGSEFDLSKGGLTKARHLKFTGTAAVDAVEATHEFATPIHGAAMHAPAPDAPEVTFSQSNKTAYVQVKNAEAYRLRLHDAKGRLCWESNAASLSGRHMLPSACSGIYFIRLVSGKTVVTKRAIVR